MTRRANGPRSKSISVCSSIVSPCRTEASLNRMSCAPRRRQTPRLRVEFASHKPHRPHTIMMGVQPPNATSGSRPGIISARRTMPWHFFEQSHRMRLQPATPTTPTTQKTVTKTVPLTTRTGREKRATMSPALPNVSHPAECRSPPPLQTSSSALGGP